MEFSFCFSLKQKHNLYFIYRKIYIFFRAQCTKIPSFERWNERVGKNSRKIRTETVAIANFTRCLCFVGKKTEKNNNIWSKRFCTARCKKKEWNLLDYINYDHRHKSSVTYYILLAVCSFFLIQPPPLCLIGLFSWLISLNMMLYYYMRVHISMKIWTVMYIVCRYCVCVWIWARTRFIYLVCFIYFDKYDSKWKLTLSKGKNSFSTSIAPFSSAFKGQFNLPCVFFKILAPFVNCFWWHSHISKRLISNGNLTKNYAFFLSTEFMIVYLNYSKMNIFSSTAW